MRVERHWRVCIIYLFLCDLELCSGPGSGKRSLQGFTDLDGRVDFSRLTFITAVAAESSSFNAGQTGTETLWSLQPFSS